MAQEIGKHINEVNSNNKKIEEKSKSETQQSEFSSPSKDKYNKNKSSITKNDNVNDHLKIIDKVSDKIFEQIKNDDFKLQSNRDKISNNLTRLIVIQFCVTYLILFISLFCDLLSDETIIIGFLGNTLMQLSGLYLYILKYYFSPRDKLIAIIKDIVTDNNPDKKKK